MLLPEEFVQYTRELMGDERFDRYLESFSEEPPVSIRLNPLKTKDGRWRVTGGESVPWCRDGYYLRRRPNFTFDPLLHAGCYYVQEAASMFLDTVLRQLLPTVNRKSPNGRCLDLCAAPGGKSTLMRTLLPEGSVLYSNEPVRQRASILLENITKWGWPDCIVTNSYPRDYRRAKLLFDVILCDVPCSGEGMFRKDAATIGEWSPQNVEKCWRLQREIVSDAWPCLCDGGLFIYSTCTFNTKENEENIRWICDEFDAEVLPVETRLEWNITGSLLSGFAAPVYRFIPGISRGEGLFMAVLRKKEKGGAGSERPDYTGGRKKANRGTDMLNVLGNQPSHLPPLNAHPPHRVELSYQQAMAFLRREALTLPEDTPLGIVEVCFLGQSLGTVKNIGTRANNLYPKEWKIKTTHIPNSYEAILETT